MSPTHADLEAQAATYFPGAQPVSTHTFESFRDALYALAKDLPGTSADRLRTLYRVTCRGAALYPPPYRAWAERVFEDELPVFETMLRKQGQW